MGLSANLMRTTPSAKAHFTKAVIRMGISLTVKNIGSEPGAVATGFFESGK